MPYPSVRRFVTPVTTALLIIFALCVGTTSARAEFVTDIQDAQPSQTKAAMAYSNFSLSVAFRVIRRRNPCSWICRRASSAY